MPGHRDSTGRVCVTNSDMTDLAGAQSDGVLGAPEGVPALLPPTRLGRGSWALFEFARSPYLVLIYIYAFGPYFANVIIGDPVRGQELWSVANTIVGLLVAILAPVLGAISDRTGRRKPWLIAIVAVMSTGCIALWWAIPGIMPPWLVLAIVVMLAGCFLLSEVFHNAMLAPLVERSKLGRLSGFGIAANNLGAMLSLVIVLFGVALPASGIEGTPFVPEQPLFGLDPALHEPDRFSGPFAGIWLVIFTLPLLLFTPDVPSRGVPAKEAVRQGWQQLRQTLRDVRRYANIVRFLIARMIYNDGKVAALAYGGLYASGTFGWGLAELLIAGLLLTPFGILGGMLGGVLDVRLGSKPTIMISISITALMLLTAISVSPDTLFFVIPLSSGEVFAPHLPLFRTLPELVYLAAFSLMGVFITVAFTSSRTMMAQISPPSMINQFFGLYALSGTATAFLGHALVGVLTSTFESQRAGFVGLVALLVIGLLLMFRVSNTARQGGGNSA